MHAAAAAAAAGGGFSPRPGDLPFETYEELSIGPHTIRIISLDPLRHWEVDLNTRASHSASQAVSLCVCASVPLHLSICLRSCVSANFDWTAMNCSIAVASLLLLPSPATLSPWRAPAP